MGLFDRTSEHIPIFRISTPDGGKIVVIRIPSRKLIELKKRLYEAEVECAIAMAQEGDEDEWIDDQVQYNHLSICFLYVPVIMNACKGMVSNLFRFWIIKSGF